MDPLRANIVQRISIPLVALLAVRIGLNVMIPIALLLLANAETMANERWITVGLGQLFVILPLPYSLLQNWRIAFLARVEQSEVKQGFVLGVR